MGSFYYPTVLSRRGEIFYRKKNEGVNKIFFLLSVFRVKSERQPKARGLTHTHTNKRRFFFLGATGEDDHKRLVEACREIELKIKEL